MVAKRQNTSMPHFDLMQLLMQTYDVYLYRNTLTRGRNGKKIDSEAEYLLKPQVDADHLVYSIECYSFRRSDRPPRLASKFKSSHLLREIFQFVHKIAAKLTKRGRNLQDFSFDSRSSQKKKRL